MMKLRTRFLAALLAALVPLLAVSGPATARAEAARSLLLGEWHGAISMPQAEIGIILRFEAAPEGPISGSMDIPAQGVAGIPLSSISLEEGAFAAVTDMPDQPAFAGQLSADGTQIEGTFGAGEMLLPFKVTRQSAVPTDPDPAVPGPGVEEPAELAGLGDFVTGVMADWQTPGAAIGVVKDGEVLFIGGFGLRDVEANLPVTPETLFAVASNTKAMTAAAFQSLAEEGLVDWDTPVREYLPGFRLQDPLVSDRITARDLASHRSGLYQAGTPFVFNERLDASEFISNLEHLPFKYDFRTKYEYNNLGYVILGEIIERVTGKSWEAVVRERVLEPVGMDSANFSVYTMQHTADFARPYMASGGEVVGLPFTPVGAAGPAGGVNASITDMTKWLLLQLNKGRVGDTQVISAAGMAEMHSPQMLRTVTAETMEAYGLGWYVQSYRGSYYVYHGGRSPGFDIQTAFLPEQDAGVVVISNGDSPVPMIVAYYVLDRLLGVEPTDYNSTMKEYVATHGGAEAVTSQAVTGKSGKAPNHDLADYAGTFSHPLFGDMQIKVAGKGLRADYYSSGIALEHHQYDQFTGTLDEPMPIAVTFQFQTDVRGEIDGFLVDMEGDGNLLRFTRQPSDALRDPAYLDKLVGQYDLQGLVVTVTRSEAVLTMDIPGQKPYTLVPEPGLRFSLKEFTGAIVEFLFGNGDEMASAVVIHQAGYAWTCDRIE